MCLISGSRFFCSMAKMTAVALCNKTLIQNCRQINNIANIVFFLCKRLIDINYVCNGNSMSSSTLHLWDNGRFCLLPKYKKIYDKSWDNFFFILKRVFILSAHSICKLFAVILIKKIALFGFIFHSKQGDLFD